MNLSGLMDTAFNYQSCYSFDAFWGKSDVTKHHFQNYFDEFWVTPDLFCFSVLLEA